MPEIPYPDAVSFEHGMKDGQPVVELRLDYEQADTRIVLGIPLEEFVKQIERIVWSIPLQP